MNKRQRKKSEKKMRLKIEAVCLFLAWMKAKYDAGFVWQVVIGSFKTAPPYLPFEPMDSSRPLVLSLKPIGDPAKLVEWRIDGKPLMDAK